MYYTIKPAVDTKETGSAFPAASSFDDYDFNSDKSVHKLRSDEFPAFDPDIRYKLAYRAKLTDLLSNASISAIGFLTSERMKNILLEFNLSKHKYFPATIKSKNETSNYYWLHLLSSQQIETIDWVKCEFVIKRFSKVLEIPKINSLNDFQKKREEYGSKGMIKITKTVIRDDIGYDLFPLNIGIDIVISERLMEKCKELKLTGLEIKPLI